MALFNHVAELHGENQWVKSSDLSYCRSGDENEMIAVALLAQGK